MLTAGCQDTGEDGMGIGACPGAVAAIGLAGDHGRSQHAFCLVIGGFQVIHIQETQQMGAVFAQAASEI
jgi:hypothetical protein